MKRVKLLVFVISIFLINYMQAESSNDIIGKTVISTVNNLRIRETPDLNSKVLGYINTGETAVINEVSSFTTKVKDKEDKWYKIKTPSCNGWVFGGFITTDYDQSADKNVILWHEGFGSEEGEAYVYIYNMNKKNSPKSVKVSIEGWEIKLSPDGKYFALITNSDGDLTLYIYQVENMKMITENSFYGDRKSDSLISWSNNNLSFKNIIFSTSHDCYVCVNSTFKDGVILNDKKEYYICRDSDGCCEDLYRVNVQVLNIYDKPDEKGKIICTAQMNDYVYKYEFEKETLSSDKSAWIQIKVRGCGDDGYTQKGYVLKKHLRKAK